MQEQAKKMKLWPIVVLILFILLLIGSTFAIFTLSLNSQKLNIIKAGNLSMILDDTTSSGIKLVNAIPMSYQQGMETVEYTFTLKNDGSTNNDYSISLVDENTYINDNDEEITITEESRLADNKIRYILLKNGEEATASKSKLLSDATDRVIDTGTINSKDEITYSLRIWIDSKAGSEVMNKIFKAKLRIDAIQAQQIEETPEVVPVGPPFYAFGQPTTASTADYTTLGKNVFVRLDTDNSLAVCINDGGLLCIKNNDYKNSVESIKAHFGEENCTSYSTNVYCGTGASFGCSVYSAYSNGDVRCYDKVAGTSCFVGSDGKVSCN